MRFASGVPPFSGSLLSLSDIVRLRRSAGGGPDWRKTYFPCHGHSLIVDPWGTILAQAPDGETSLVADLDLEWLERIREELPSLRNRNPAAYRWP